MPETDSDAWVSVVTFNGLVYEFWDEAVPECWYEFGLAPLEDSTLMPEPDVGQQDQPMADGRVDGGRRTGGRASLNGALPRRWRCLLTRYSPHRSPRIRLNRY